MTTYIYQSHVIGKMNGKIQFDTADDDNSIISPYMQLRKFVACNKLFPLEWSTQVRNLTIAPPW